MNQMHLRTLIAGLCLLAGTSNTNSYAQDLRNPLDFAPLLSGNFGELRNNHFHSGIDFKTQGVTGKPIYAVQDGYVARILVSPWGFGRALYLNHPDGTTTVYGHMNKFTNEIEAYVKAQQYKQEVFNVNLFPDPQIFPVKRGDLIAISGNAGSSGGPHLHFEVRDTKSEETIDPLDYYKHLITDTRPPKVQGVMICPIEGKGVVNGSSRNLELKVVTAKNGKQTLTGKAEAWGEIGLAIKAYDYMDNTSNIYGVKEISLKEGDQVIYHSNLDHFAFDETRFINSYVDYEAWKERRSFYMCSFVEPGNRLRFIESLNRGIVRIEKEKTYQLSYRLSDAYGNSTNLSVWIEGKKQPIPKPDPDKTDLFRWATDNRFGAKGIRLVVPKGNLYSDLHFHYNVKEDATALAATHTLHNRPVPIHQTAKLSLFLQQDTLPNKQQYGIVRLLKGGRSWIGGTYRSGWLDADIKEFGNYTIAADATPPTITPIGAGNWIGKQAFVFRLSDNLSGVQTFRGEIDGNFVLFTMDNRSVITYKFDKERLKRGKHTLKLTATDLAGNEAEYTYPFVW